MIYQKQEKLWKILSVMFMRKTSLKQEQLNLLIERKEVLMVLVIMNIMAMTSIMEPIMVARPRDPTWALTLLAQLDTVPQLVEDLTQDMSVVVHNQVNSAVRTTMN